MSKSGTFYKKGLFQGGKYEPPKHLQNEPSVIAKNAAINLDGIKSKTLLFDLYGYEAKNEYQVKAIKILIRDNGVCGLCKTEISRLKEFNLDHIIPRSLGGSNSYENLQATHKKCNSLKGSRLENLPPEYYQNFKASNKKVLFKIPENTTPKVDYCVELYNEIQRHGTTRMSYKMFKDYFIKFAEATI